MFLAVIAAGCVIFVAKPVLLPVTFGILVALTLSPLVRTAGRFGIPPSVSSISLVIAFGLTVLIGGYLIAPAATDLLQSAPEIQLEIQRKIATLSSSMAELMQVSANVEDIAGSTPSDVQKVDVQDGGLLTSAAINMASILASGLVALVLSLFLLASGDTMQQKIISAQPTASKRRRARAILQAVEVSVSRYLLSISIINFGLGCVVTLALWALGVPEPVVWGALAFILNFMPYLGPGIFTVVIALVSFVSFDTIGQAIYPPLAFMLINAMEGNVVTPVVVGRSMSLNPIVVFISVVLWAWLWGVAGALVAVPMLVCLKVVCDHVPGLAMLGHFLGPKGAVFPGRRRQGFT